MGIGASWALDLTPTTKFKSLDCQKIKAAHKGGASNGNFFFGGFGVWVTLGPKVFLSGSYD